jgi:hypothetical protein
VSNYIQLQETRWNEIGSIIEELYGMVHTLNDCFDDGLIDLAKKEGTDIERQMVKLLDLYNEIEGDSN